MVQSGLLVYHPVGKPVRLSQGGRGSGRIVHVQLAQAAAAPGHPALQAGDGVLVNDVNMAEQNGAVDESGLPGGIDA